MKNFRFKFTYTVQFIMTEYDLDNEAATSAVVSEMARYGFR